MERYTREEKKGYLKLMMSSTLRLNRFTPATARKIRF
jgi:hypothetical protein